MQVKYLVLSGIFLLVVSVAFGFYSVTLLDRCSCRAGSPILRVVIKYTSVDGPNLGGVCIVLSSIPLNTEHSTNTDNRIE